MVKQTLTYFALGSLFLLSSCTQEETIGNLSAEGSRAITFRATLPELTTRATEMSGSTLRSFQVSSFITGTTSLTPYFADKTFTKRDNRFTSADPTCVWPDAETQLRFIAFAPSCVAMRENGGFGAADFKLSEVTVGEEMTTLDYKLGNFKVATDIAKQLDFVTASTLATLTADAEEGITMNLQHQLSRIEINAWSANKSYNIDIAGVRLGGVCVAGNFNFIPKDATPTTPGQWESTSRGRVEYIFCEGDQVITLDQSASSPNSAAKSVSIMGKKIGGEAGYANSAMVIPANNPAWDYKNNRTNVADAPNNKTQGMYFSVLLSVADITSNTSGEQVYPISGESEIVYLAVDAATKKTVKTRLYRQGADYFTDSTFTTKYDLTANAAVVKEFGWAALPVGDTWKPGYLYTYHLNYSDGVGLYDPEDPKYPGEPIISDKVRVEVEVAIWNPAKEEDYNPGISVPRK